MIEIFRKEKFSLDYRTNSVIWCWTEDRSTFPHVHISNLLKLISRLSKWSFFRHLPISSSSEMNGANGTMWFVNVEYALIEWNVFFAESIAAQGTGISLQFFNVVNK